MNRRQRNNNRQTSLEARADLRAKRRLAAMRDPAYIAWVAQQSEITLDIDRDAVLNEIAAAWQVPAWRLRGEASPIRSAP
jgi:hypothetical protein